MKRVLAAGASAVMALGFATPAAHAQQPSTLSTQLSALNRSGASGSAMVTLEGNQVTGTSVPPAGTSTVRPRVSQALR